MVKGSNEIIGLSLLEKLQPKYERSLLDLGGYLDIGGTNHRPYRGYRGNGRDSSSSEEYRRYLGS